MQQTKKQSIMPLIGGILYALAALLSLVNLINYCATNGRYGMVSAAHVISTLLLIGGYVVLAVALLMKKEIFFCLWASCSWQLPTFLASPPQAFSECWPISPWPF